MSISCGVDNVLQILVCLSHVEHVGLHHRVLTPFLAHVLLTLMQFNRSDVELIFEKMLSKISAGKRSAAGRRLIRSTTASSAGVAWPSEDTESLFAMKKSDSS